MSHFYHILSACPVHRSTHVCALALSMPPFAPLRNRACIFLQEATRYTHRATRHIRVVKLDFADYWTPNQICWQAEAPNSRDTATVPVFPRIAKPGEALGARHRVKACVCARRRVAGAMRAARSLAVLLFVISAASNCQALILSQSECLVRRPTR
jgi:hypothetical protein